MVSDLNFRVTGKQVGNGIGALLASIGISLAIEAVKKLTGKGATGGSSMRIGKGSPRIGRPPPFIGSWEGRGKKKRPERSGTNSRKAFPIQQNSNHRSHLVKFNRDTPMIKR